MAGDGGQVCCGIASGKFTVTDRSADNIQPTKKGTRMFFFGMAALLSPSSELIPVQQWDFALTQKVKMK